MGDNASFTGNGHKANQHIAYNDVHFCISDLN